MAKKKKLTKRQVALRNGFRSGIEDDVAKQLKEAGVTFKYEGEKLEFVQPEKHRTYNPDFPLYNKDGSLNMIVETKGRWNKADRDKMKWVREQHPHLDIRMVFTRSKDKDPRAKTTYGQWCDKMNMKYADKLIPKEWLDEVDK